MSAYKIGSTGALTPVTGSPFATGNSPYSLTVDPVGNFAYVANDQDNTVSAYSIGSNGALTPVSGSPFATGQYPTSVTVDPTGRVRVRNQRKRQQRLGLQHLVKRSTDTGHGIALRSGAISLFSWP